MYYSDIRLVTTPRGYSLLLDMAGEGTATGIIIDGLKEFLDKADVAEYHADGNYILLGWDEIEWDREKEGEKERAFYQALDELEKRYVAFKFVRAGDDPKDVEERYSWVKGYILPDLYVTRVIKVWPDDGPGSDLKFLRTYTPDELYKILEKARDMEFMETAKEADL